MLLSIIVPVYNVEAYLERCVESLLRQGLSEDSYEIILVNDGSTDGSLSICQRYSEQYACVRVVTQENQGISCARNTGINKAKGDYICFVDSDDYLDDEGLGKLLPWCNENFDLIRFWCRIIHPHTSHLLTPETIVESFRGSGTEYLQQFGLETFCWNWLYRREFLLKNNLSFILGLIGEDFCFMADVLFANPSVVSLECRIYNYVIRDNSITTRKTVEHSRRWVRDLIWTIDRIYRKTIGYKETNELLYNHCMDSLQGKMLPLFSRVMFCDYKHSAFMNEVLIPMRSIKILPIRQFSGGYLVIISKVIINLLNLMPWIYRPAQWLFINVFYKHLYSRIDRNG